jgi:hypothetical protein
MGSLLMAQAVFHGWMQQNKEGKPYIIRMDVKLTETPHELTESPKVGSQFAIMFSIEIML